MPCFTQQIIHNQILINVFITASDVGSDDKNYDTRSAISFRALVDTGATRSCVSHRVVKKMKIEAIDKKQVQTAAGLSESNLYRVNFHIPVVVGGEQYEQKLNLKNFFELDVSEVSLSEHYDVLLGMDVIMHGALHVSGNQFTFCT